ncbi:hypothetical protein MPH_13963 [Macrophomina phaseolina MS6]|uniref:Uncharacterized protein n=1 Tax=Macrophomina phaseolina (strain MS6) TaxID=1126212 RepID=K2R4G5_MACPH|nr:hypothetical protein MPH_13963 [Macrophomina phaseolina MS6]
MKIFIDAPTATTTALPTAYAWVTRPSIQRGSSRETGIRKPPDVRLPGSQPGPTLALSSQPMWTHPRRTTGHPWACTGFEIAENAARAQGNLFSENLLRLTCCRPSAQPRELVKASPREPIRRVHKGDLAEGLNRRGARNLVRCDRSARRDGNTGKLWGRETQASFDGTQRTC